tara:strand:+ start:1195 stop:1332 length:138 start_codon:yes stop_codon:yes gene_type:complete
MGNVDDIAIELAVVSGNSNDKACVSHIVLSVIIEPDVEDAHVLLV